MNESEFNRLLSSVRTSVRALEKLLAKLAVNRASPRELLQGSDRRVDRQVRALADRMQQELGTKVEISPSRILPNGKREVGRLVIEFYDETDLTRLLESMNLGDLAT